MTLNQIIKIADEAYGDGLIVLAWSYIKRGKQPPSTKIGCGLAVHIANELKETYLPLSKEGSGVEQLVEALRVMGNAKKDIEKVEMALSSRLSSLQRKNRMIDPS